MTMMAPGGPAMATFTAFLSFHHELLAVIGQIEAAELSETSEGGEREMCFQVFARLKAAVSGHGAMIGGGTSDSYLDARYVMAALADEMMLHEVTWGGHGWWADNLLEHHLFRSSLCGEKIFRLGHDLLEGRLPGRTDLAMAILLALGLGFRGRYRGVDDRGAILDLRLRLYEMVYRRPPPRRIDWEESMPEMAVPSLAPGKERRQRRPQLRLWLVLIAVLAVGYWVASYGLWNGITRDLRANAQAVANPALRQP